MIYLADVRPTDVQSWLSIQNVTVAGLLLVAVIVIVWGLLKTWWVPGWLYKQEKANSEKWEKLFLETRSQLHQTGQALQTTVRVIEKTAGPQ